MSKASTTFLQYQQEQSNFYDSCEWAELYHQEQAQDEYYQWEKEQAATAPVVALYTDLTPAPAAAVQVPRDSPMVEQLLKHQDAIQATLSELNMMLLNATTFELRTQLKAIATGLVNKSGLLDSTKANYTQMLDAAEANATFYFGSQQVVPKPYDTPYKRKYDTAVQIGKHLATTSTLKEITSLHYINAELIEITSHLKKAFNDRKAILYKQAAA